MCKKVRFDAFSITFVEGNKVFKMKNFNLKSLLPHAISVAIILIMTVLFCMPAMQGLKLEQHDMVAVKGMIKSNTDHFEKTGNYPLWNTHMFSGMPNYQIFYTWDSPLLNFGKIMSVGLPEPANFFFLAAIAFYILGLTFGLSPYIALFSAISYAFSSYNPQIINAGHMTKIAALAYAPGVLAGLKLLFDKKYWIGLVITTLYLSMEVTANHPQITYYLFIICLLMSFVYFIDWIKNKDFSHVGKTIAAAMVAILISVGNAAPILMNSVEYGKYTMRGGKNIEVKNKQIVQTKTTGLDYDYASMWSIKIPEIITLFLPDSYGTGSSKTLPEDSKFVKKLEEENIPPENAQQLATQLPAYWGGLESVVGPNYLGIIAFLLALLGIFTSRDKNAVWIGLSILIGAILAFGKYLPGVNEFIFHTVPVYNKFRAPSMSLVMIQLLVPLAAGLFVSKTTKEDFVIEKNFFKKIMYVFGGVVAVLIILYLFNDYSSPFIDAQLKEFFDKNQSGGRNMSTIILDALKDQRKATFGGSMIIALVYCAGLIALFKLYISKNIKAQVLIVILLLVNSADLFNNGLKYLNKENYLDSEELMTKNFTPNNVDEIILKDKDPHFRVYNLSSEAFSETRTSYFHRSIGGYHAAKLRNYQDIIETKFNGQLSMNLLNMLDTRYFIMPGEPANGVPAQVNKNEQALGAAWLVDSIRIVGNQAQELTLIDSINPTTTALISERTGSNETVFKKDSTSYIKLIKYDNDQITYSFESKEKQFAVYSEVYYPAGWNAYIDGKLTSYDRVNYFLRGMEIPAGKHEVQFVFEPATYARSSNIANFSGWAFYIVILGGLTMLFLQTRRSENN